MASEQLLSQPPVLLAEPLTLLFPLPRENPQGLLRSQSSRKTPPYKATFCTPKVGSHSLVQWGDGGPVGCLSGWACLASCPYSQRPIDEVAHHQQHHPILQTEAGEGEWGGEFVRLQEERILSKEGGGHSLRSPCTWAHCTAGCSLCTAHGRSCARCQNLGGGERRRH